jgi:soluble cytochrome b562
VLGATECDISLKTTRAFRVRIAAARHTSSLSSSVRQSSVMDSARVKERITVEVDDLIRFLNELHREIEQGKVDDAMRSIRQQIAIVRGKPKAEGVGPSQG